MIDDGADVMKRLAVNARSSIHRIARLWVLVVVAVLLCFGSAAIYRARDRDDDGNPPSVSYHVVLTERNRVLNESVLNDSRSTDSWGTPFQTTANLTQTQGLKGVPRFTSTKHSSQNVAKQFAPGRDGLRFASVEIASGSNAIERLDSARRGLVDPYLDRLGAMLDGMPEGFGVPIDNWRLLPTEEKLQMAALRDAQLGASTTEQGSLARLSSDLAKRYETVNGFEFAPLTRNPRIGNLDSPKLGIHPFHSAPSQYLDAATQLLDYRDGPIFGSPAGQLQDLLQLSPSESIELLQMHGGFEPAFMDVFAKRAEHDQLHVLRKLYSETILPYEAPRHSPSLDFLRKTPGPRMAQIPQKMPVLRVKTQAAPSGVKSLIRFFKFP
jgi:hypothetical protein